MSESKKPATDEPADKKAASKKTASKKTAAKKSSKKKAVSKKTAAKKSSKKKAAKAAPAVETPPVENRTVIKRSPKKAAAADKAATDKPTSDKAAAEKGTADKPASDKSARSKTTKKAAAAPSADEKASDKTAKSKEKSAAKPGKAVKPLGPAAKLAAEAAAKRAEAGDEAVPPPISNIEGPAGLGPAPDPANQGPARKVRRSRSIAGKPGDGGEGRRRRSRRPRDRDRGEGDRNGGRRTGPGGQRSPGPGGGRGRGRGAGGGTAMERLLATPRRTIYRQDGGTPEPPKEPSKTEVRAKAAAKSKESDKITLILHPAPKASYHAKKAASRPQTAKEMLKAKAKRNKKGQQGAAKKQPSATPVKLQDSWLTAAGDDALAAAKAAGDSGEALIQAWIGNQNIDAIAQVSWAQTLAGKTRKAARRAINVLKSRGVEVPEAPQAAVVVDAPQEETIATFVPPDGSGVSFFSISKHRPGSRFHVADAVVRPPLGIVQASAGHLAGKQIRAWRQRVEKHFGASPVEVPLAWARFRIAQAKLLNNTSKQLLPLGYDRCVVLFDPAPETEPAHPVADLEASIDSASVDAAKADSSDLHNEPEFRSWMPDTQAMQELLQKVGERVGADGVDDPKVVDAALKEEITSATDRFFSPERRAVVANHMRDSAISVRGRAGDDSATRVLAVSRAVKEAGLITSPPSEIPFLVAYFQKAVAVMLQQQGGMLRVPVPRASS